MDSGICPLSGRCLIAVVMRVGELLSVTKYFDYFVDCKEKCINFGQNLTL